MVVEFFKKFLKNRELANLKDEKFSFLFEEDISGEYVAFDTETTGLNPKKDEILSIGAVKIKGNKILTSQTFEVYIKNSIEIDAKSIEIHHIRPADLLDAKRVDEALKEFLFFIGSRPLVGYYLEFDVKMVNRYLKLKLGITLPNRMIELSELYYDKEIKFIPDGNVDLRFETILKRCNIPNMGTHNAVNDAVMSAMIFLKLSSKT